MPRNKKHPSSRPGRTLLAFFVAGVALLVLATVSLLGRSGAGRAAIEVRGQPRLKADRLSIDLGDVRLGEAVKATFVLTNVGDQPLQLTQAPYIEVVEGC